MEQLIKQEDGKPINNLMNNDQYNASRYEQMPWSEKHRPREISELVFCNDEIKKKIYMFIDTKSIPNILFSGYPGIGKTTTIRCIAKAVYGIYYDDYVLELNASDNRGIKTVQIDIINFCKAKKITHSEADKDKYCNKKMVILDEADNMMDKAQAQINTLMEQYRDSVIFAFTCNDSSCIIESLQSRCLILKYSKYSNKQISVRLKQICAKENVEHDKKILNEICELSNGDLRVAVNYIQVMYNKYNCLKIEYISDICNVPQATTIKSMFINSQAKKLKNNIKLLRLLITQGYSYNDIINGMLYTIKSFHCEEFSNDTKIMFMNKICKTYMEISRYGANTSQTQIIALLIDMENE
jgi:replication factor C subunit 2/4